jgi:chromosome partitioning protein
VNVGYTLAKHFNKKVLLIDVDPQMNATQYTLNESQVNDIISNPNRTLYGLLQDRPHLPSMVANPTVSTSDQVIYKINDNFDIIPSHLNIMSINLDSSPFR